MERVAFIGGNTSLPNFEARAIIDFERLWQQNLNLLAGERMKHDPFLASSKNFLRPLPITSIDRDMVYYKGLYLLSHIIQQKDMISASEYKEMGALQSIQRKNINKLNF